MTLASSSASFFGWGGEGLGRLEIIVGECENLCGRAVLDWWSRWRHTTSSQWGGALANSAVEFCNFGKFLFKASKAPRGTKRRKATRLRHGKLVLYGWFHDRKVPAGDKTTSKMMLRRLLTENDVLLR